MVLLERPDDLPGSICGHTIGDDHFRAFCRVVLVEHGPQKMSDERGFVADRHDDRHQRLPAFYGVVLHSGSSHASLTLRFAWVPGAYSIHRQSRKTQAEVSASPAARAGYPRSGWGPRQHRLIEHDHIP